MTAGGWGGVWRNIESKKGKLYIDRVGQHIADHLTFGSNLSAKCIFSSFIWKSVLRPSSPSPLMPTAKTLHPHFTPAPYLYKFSPSYLPFFLFPPRPFMAFTFLLWRRPLVVHPRPRPSRCVLTFLRRTLKCRWRNNSSKRFKVKSIPRNHIF